MSFFGTVAIMELTAGPEKWSSSRIRLEEANFRCCLTVLRRMTYRRRRSRLDSEHLDEAGRYYLIPVACRNIRQAEILCAGGNSIHRKKRGDYL